MIKHVQIRLEGEEIEVFDAKVKASGLPQQQAGKKVLLDWARLPTTGAAVPSEMPSSAGNPELVESLAATLPRIDENVSLILGILRENGKITGIAKPPKRPRKPGNDGASLIAEREAESKRNKKEIARLRKQVAEAAPRDSGALPRKPSQMK